MTDFGVIAGINVSKDRLDVCMHQDGWGFSMANDPKGIRRDVQIWFIVWATTRSQLVRRDGFLG